MTSSPGVFPYAAIARSSARVTRTPDSEVSTSSAGASRLTASTMVSTRMVRPSMS